MSHGRRSFNLDQSRERICREIDRRNAETRKLDAQLEENQLQMQKIGWLIADAELNHEKQLSYLQKLRETTARQELDELRRRCEEGQNKLAQEKKKYREQLKDSSLMTMIDGEVNKIKGKLEEAEELKAQIIDLLKVEGSPVAASLPSASSASRSSIGEKSTEDRKSFY